MFPLCSCLFIYIFILGLAPLSLSSSNESPSSNPPAPNPPYKMEPMDTSMYYHGGVPEPGEHHNGGPPSFQVKGIFQNKFSQRKKVA